MKVAIVKDCGCLPTYTWFTEWIGLCSKFQIENCVFDSESEEFLSSIISYKPDRILWRVGHHSTELKRKDEWQRQTLEVHTNFRVVPNWKTHYFYDHKVLQTYLFQIHKIPHPKTHIFFRREEADKFLQRASYPIIVKADAGAGSASFRFLSDYKEAANQLEENFGMGLRYYRGYKACSTEDKREKGIFYVQEYIPAPGIFRIVMIGDDVAYGFYLKNKPGTKIASSQGHYSYLSIPIELLDLTAKVNREMGWDYMMYDCIWKEATKQWLILETTDTCGSSVSIKRKISYYFRDGEWREESGHASPPELVFNKYILGIQK